MIIQSSINTQNSELSQLIDILSKPVLKHIKCFIRESLDFLIKCTRDTDEDTETVIFDVIRLYTSITQKFGLEATY